MGRKKSKNKENRCCETCSNLVAIGEGDHICLECDGQGIMPVSEYVPTDEYFWCRGDKWEEK